MAVLLVSRLAAASKQTALNPGGLNNRNKCIQCLCSMRINQGFCPAELCPHSETQLTEHPLSGTCLVAMGEGKMGVRERMRACAQTSNIQLQVPLTVPSILHSPTQVHVHTYFKGVWKHHSTVCLEGQSEY